MAKDTTTSDTVINQTDNSADKQTTTEKSYKAILFQCIKYEGKPYTVGSELTISSDKTDILKPYAIIKEV